MKKIRILHLISTLDVGGVQGQLLEVVKRMDRRIFENYVGTFSPGGKWEILYREEKIPVVIFKRGFRFDPLLIWRIYSFLREKDIRILHTYLFTANTWGRLAGILASPSLIIASERNAIPWKKFPHLFLDYALSDFTHKIITCSEAVRELSIRRSRIPPYKIGVLYNGVDVEKFRPRDKEECREKISLPGGKKIIGSLGRIHPCKGYVYLLKAGKEILSLYPEVAFVIGGEGEEKKRLENQVKREKIEGNFYFPGYVEDRVSFLNSLDMAIFPSLYEGLGMSILEAMSCGIPVVASQTGGIREIIEDGKNGILVPPGEVRKLTQVILWLLRNPYKAKKLGEEGRRRIKEKFRIEKTVERLQELYLSLI